MQWEYKVTRWFEGGSTAMDVAALDSLGDEGWELVLTVDDHHEAPDWKSNPALIFKRPRD